MLGLVFWEGHVVDSSQERADGSLLLSLCEDPSYRPRWSCPETWCRNGGCPWYRYRRDASCQLAIAGSLTSPFTPTVASVSSDM